MREGGRKERKKGRKERKEGRNKDRNKKRYKERKRKKQIPITSSSFSSSSSNTGFNTISFLSSGILSFIYIVFPNFTLFCFCRITLKSFCCCAYLGKRKIKFIWKIIVVKIGSRNYSYFLIFLMSVGIGSGMMSHFCSWFAPSFFQQSCRGYQFYLKRLRTNFCLCWYSLLYFVFYYIDFYSWLLLPVSFFQFYFIVVSTNMRSTLKFLSVHTYYIINMYINNLIHCCW